MFTFPSTQNNETSQAYLRARACIILWWWFGNKKEATSTTSSKAHYFAKYARKPFRLKVETTNFLYYFRQKHIEYNQASEEEIIATFYMRPKCKQITWANIAGLLANSTAYERKSKWWIEITDVIMWLKSRVLGNWLKCLAQDATSQVDNMCSSWSVRRLRLL